MWIVVYDRVYLLVCLLQCFVRYLPDQLSSLLISGHRVLRKGIDLLSYRFGRTKQRIEVLRLPVGTVSLSLEFLIVAWTVDLVSKLLYSGSIHLNMSVWEVLDRTVLGRQLNLAVDLVKVL